MNLLLKEKRRRIDALDTKLSALLAERLALASSMAGLKRKVRDPERETLVLNRAAGHIRNPELRAAVTTVYRELLKQGRRLQASVNRGRRGPAGR